MARHPTRWLAGLLVAGLASAPLEAQTVYRVVDPAGNVTFTDNPDSGGRKIKLAPLQGVSSVTPRAPAAAVRPRAAAGSPFMPYDRFVIVRPEQAARLAPAPFAVEVDVSPKLRDDHRIRLLVDGSLSQSALHGRAFWVPRLGPGPHRLQAELLGADGRVRHRTPALEVNVMPEG